ncbi:MAG: hypothetical protein RIA69_20275 [Cyclobacteriaceae bacterium]
MKLLLITAVREFGKDIKVLLKKSGVKVFSYQEVTGHKDLTNEPMTGNWFASDAHEFESILFYAFVEENLVELVFEKVGEYNGKLKSQSHLHVTMLNIEKSN